MKKGKEVLSIDATLQAGGDAQKKGRPVKKEAAPAPTAAPIRRPTSRNTMAIEPFDFLGSAAVPSILNPPSSHSINGWEIDFFKQFVAINTFVDYPGTK